MQSVFVAEDSLAAIELNLQTLLALPEVHAVLVMVASGHSFSSSALDPLLQRAEKPVFGGIFPSVMWEEHQFTTGAVMLGLPCEVQLAVLDELTLQGEALDAALQDVLVLDDGERETLFTFVDGCSDHISNLVSALFNQYGLELNYIGGGCGSASFEPMPCVITPTGVLQGAAVLVLARCPSGVGVAHGWKPISGALKVTEAEGNRIISLDWVPAFEVYQQVVESHSGELFAEQGFLQLAKAYPFGIATLGQEMVIRDPVQCVNNTLVCVGEVRRGAYVHIMHGKADELIQAARLASELALTSFGPEKPSTMIFVNCVSRSLFLGADFSREMTAVHQTGLPMLGALTLGEIANSGEDYLELFNKTSVVGLL
jgi:hypothetical protein